MNTSPSTKSSFLDLISNYCIIIPPLQRDYAQGRSEEFEKLKKFTQFLKQALIEKRVINLDFVFGYFEKEKGTNTFIPIDGQQRLTTVFLLHFYLACLSGNYVDFQNLITKENVLRFTYKTRLACQEFIATLVKNPLSREILLIEKIKPSDIIENCGWFYKPWKQEATIQAMLNALDTIHMNFKEEEEISEMYSRLDNGIISFEFLNPDEIELSDEFYIKMNARGLPLTEFENFKADFLDELTDKFPHLKTKFSSKIDGEWSDALWNWSVRANNSFDNCFGKVFDFLFQMLYSKKFESQEASQYKMLSHFKKLLSDRNLDFIYNVLEIFQQLDKHYNELSSDLQKSYTKLFEAGSLNHSAKLKLYGMLQYQNNYGIKIQADEHFNDFKRIVGNILTNTNQSKKQDFVSDLRTSRYKELIEFIDKLLNENNPYAALTSLSSNNNVFSHEIEKAKLVINNLPIKKQLQRLEDHPYLNGCLVNFVFLFNDSEKSEHSIDMFYKLWNPNKDNDLELYKALFSIGDYKVNVAGSGLGNLYYAGAFKKWNRVLANTNRESEKQIQIFEDLFKHLINSQIENVFEKLKELPLPAKNSWRYYFVKYPEILKKHELFAVNNYEVDIGRIELLTRSILSTDHVGYLNRAVALELKNRGYQKLDELNYYTSGVLWSKIKIKETIIKFNGSMWEIKTNLVLSDTNTLKFRNLENGSFTIDSDEQDLVEQMVSFIETYFN